MKLVWSPETALESYLDTIKSCKGLDQSGEAEFLAAMAGGRNAKLILEVWTQGASISISVGLSVAARHTNGRHICIMANQLQKAKYMAAMHGFVAPRLPEIIVGKAEEVIGKVEGVDFMVIDGGRKDLIRLLQSVNVSQRGTVLVCRNVRDRMLEDFRWDKVVRVIRSVVLPVGNGLDIAYVGCSVGCGREIEMEKAVTASTRRRRRWFKHVDVESGEEHVFMMRQ